MTRTTISLPEDLLRKLKRAAAERNISMAELLREAAEEKVARTRPLPKSLAAFSSDPSLPPVDHEARVPPRRSYDHIMGRGEWAVDKDHLGARGLD